MTRIVITHYRYKRPPRNRKAVALAVAEVAPVVVTPTVITARRPGRRAADAPDVTPEERQRRGETADALFRELSARADKART